MTSLVDFVTQGKIGSLSLGVSKTELINSLNEPKDWLGKKTIIGQTHALYHQSELWFYYEGCVGVNFEGASIAGEIILPQEF